MLLMRMIYVNVVQLLDLYSLLWAGGSVVYQSRTQTVTAGSSTEAKFFAAYSAGKIARYLRALLFELGFEQQGPTPIYIDNEPALRIINDNSTPTERVRHVAILELHFVWID